MSHSNSDNDGTVIRPGTAAELPLPGHKEVAKAGGASPSDNAEDSLSLRIGTRMAEFEITDRIGEGGFSIVYLAMDHSLERTVALKEYMPSSLAARVGATQVQPRSSRYRETFEAGLKSFVNEAKLLAQFDHPALVKVYRFWEANGTAYMVMPYYQGMTLKDATRALPAPPDEAWLMTVLAPLTEALMVIHAEHCYHRDIAPDNVLLLAGSGRPLLLDFGAARRVIGDMTQALTVILKPGYAPVEQYAEVPGMKQGPWTDVYALGAVVYWAITGKTPPAAVGRVMSDSFVPLAKCAAGRYTLPFLQAIDRALVVLPEQRTPSIEAFRLDLGLSAKGQGSAQSPMKGIDPDSTLIKLPPSNSTASTGGTSIRDVYPLSSTDPEIGLSAVGGMNALALPTNSMGATERIVDAPTPQMTAKEEFHFQASSQVLEEASARQGSEPGEVPIVSDIKSRRVPMILSSAAVAAALAAAGIWLALQTPGPQLAPSTVDASRTPALADQPPAKQGPTAATGANVPAPSTSLPLQPSTQPDGELTKSAATEGSRTAAQGPTRASEKATGKLSARTSNLAAPTIEGGEQTEQKALRVSPRTEAARPERRQADSAISDECASIAHRLSLGESSPELVARLRTLNCR
jgi:serine/threonine protein kinase